MVVPSLWDKIYGAVAQVVDTDWQSATPAKGVLSAGHAQPSRICDDKLVQSAIKVCLLMLLLFSFFSFFFVFKKSVKVGDEQ